MASVISDEDVAIHNAEQSGRLVVTVMRYSTTVITALPQLYALTNAPCCSHVQTKIGR